VWLVLAVLCAWAFITILRRIAEAQRSERWPDAKVDSGNQEESLEDSIDWEEL
jgi:hypothetical protein